MKALTKTDFHFEGQKSVYHGKVRDVYNIGLLPSSWMLPVTSAPTGNWLLPTPWLPLV